MLVNKRQPSDGRKLGIIVCGKRDGGNLVQLFASVWVLEMEISVVTLME